MSVPLVGTVSFTVCTSCDHLHKKIITDIRAVYSPRTYHEREEDGSEMPPSVRLTRLEVRGIYALLTDPSNVCVHGVYLPSVLSQSRESSIARAVASLMLITSIPFGTSVICANTQFIARQLFNKVKISTIIIKKKVLRFTGTHHWSIKSFNIFCGYTVYFSSS